MVDELSQLTKATPATLGREVIVEILQQPSVRHTKDTVGEVEEVGDNWMTPITAYLLNGTLPENKHEQGASD